MPSSLFDAALRQYDGITPADSPAQLADLPFRAGVADCACEDNETFAGTLHRVRLPSLAASVDRTGRLLAMRTLTYPMTG